MMKRRCLVLEAHEDKNRYKTFEQEKKIRFFEDTQVTKKKEKQQGEKVRLQRDKLMQMQKERNERLNEQTRKKIHSVMETISKEKKTINEEEKATKKSNEKKIYEFQKDNFQSLVARRKEIELQEKKQKEHVEVFRKQKITDTKMNKSVEIDDYVRKLKKREKELEKISFMEEEMIKKHADSLQASNTVKNRLSEVLNGKAKRYTADVSTPDNQTHQTLQY